MALTSKDINIGSGNLYVMLNTNGVIPEDSVIETEDNRLGHIKDGATLSYTPTYYQAKDDMGLVAKTILTEEELVFKSGVMTWNLDTLNKLVSTGTVSTESNKKVLKLGGINNSDIKNYCLRFVHADKKHRVTIIGNNQAGLELGFQKDKETVVDAEFHALPMSDGHLLIFEDSTGTV